MFVMEGGMESAFKSVEPAKYVPRLLHIRGTGKNIGVTEVPLERSSLNQGDVFLLDKGLKIYQWNGSASSLLEKRRATEVSQSIANDRKGAAKLTVLESNDNSESEFWISLGGFGTIKSAEEGSKLSDNICHEKKLFSLSDKNGKLEFSLVCKGKLSKSLLNSDDVFILDQGIQIFSWVGKQASADEKKKALEYAQNYLQSTNLPLSTPISRLVEGGETESFLKSFE